MKFVKIPALDGKNAIVRLDMEGLKLPDIPKDIQNPLALLDFEITTYRACMARTKPGDWEKLCECPNKFFATLSDKDKIAIAQCIWFMHYRLRDVINVANIDMSTDDEDIMQLNSQKVEGISNELADALDALDTDIDLYRKVHNFVVEYVPIRDRADTGTRPLDTESKTFRVHEKQDLNTLVIICKIMMPIMGTMIRAFNEVGITDKHYSEMYVFHIYHKLLDKHCAAVINKLEGYITETVIKSRKRVRGTSTAESDVGNIFKGETLSVMVTLVYAIIFTHKFVNIDILAKDADIMVYIFSCAKSTAQNPRSGSDGANYRIRFTPEDKQSDSGDDGNESIMETESIVSDKTADTQILVEFAVNNLVERFCIKHGITTESFAAAENYYRTEGHLQLNIANTYILGTVFGDEILGAKSMEFISAKSLITLTVLLQLYLINEGYYDLVDLVSASPTNVLRNADELLGDIRVLSANWANNPAYRNCEAKLQFATSDIVWDGRLKQIIDSITSYKYAINTAPAIQELMGRENMNGLVYQPAPTVGEHICMLFLSTIDPNAETNVA